jgi:hypothetical protein
MHVAPRHIEKFISHAVDLGEDTSGSGFAEDAAAPSDSR